MEAVMNVNIKDVAREAKVSISTVSRVLNNNYPVKEETRARVEEVIEKLNFNPNILARSLINKSTKTIGIIVPDINNLIYPTIVKAIEHVLRKKGFSIYLCDSNDNAAEETSYVKSLLSRQVDGIIAVYPKKENIENGFYEDISKNVPLVCINGFSEGINCSFVVNNELSGTRQALEYLMSLGYKNIIFVRRKKSYSDDMKEAVYKDMLEEYSLKNNKKVIRINERENCETVDNASNVISRKLKDIKTPVAVFACNDILALGVINACKKIGYDVPNDVSVIGFNNIEISSMVEPKLTTVDQNLYLLGDNAANMLLDIIQNNNKKVKKVSLNTQLIIRNSCAKIS